MQPDELVIIGDFADFYAVSSHDKSPSRRETMKDEVDGCNDLLDIIDGMGFAKKHYVMGNHEYRLDRYIAKQAPELYGLAPMTEGMLRLKERGFGVTQYREEYSIGKIDITHDVGPCGSTAMQRSLSTYGHNLVIGHTHRLGVAYQGTKRGGTMVCMNVGWLGDFDSIDYRQKSLATNDWQHGFGYVDFDSEGNGWCVPVPIIDGTCKIQGAFVRG